jgi:hypothetical protein
LIGHLSKLAVLILAVSGAASRAAQPAPPREVDARRLAAAGLRVVEGRYVRLVTDVPSNPAVDELPAVFDAAVPEWATYFQLPENRVRGRWLAFLVEDRQRFASLNLLPENNPDFVNGFARDYELWLIEQSSDYYRRHLYLHEGTHAFMQTQLGGCGDGWYMEGMAELLGTHRWQDGRLQLGVFPARKEDLPMWGRIKLVRDAVAAGKALPLEAVLQVDNRRKLSTEHYAWTWALAALLDGHPQYQARFRDLKRYVADPAFGEHFRQAFATDWDVLLVEWSAYVATLDYGYDVARMAMVHRPTVEVGSQPQKIDVAADRGWQSTGWRLKAGQAYNVNASGRFKIANDGQPWPCEAGGVTIEYHDGRPLGMLLGAFRTEPRNGAFGSPMAIGLKATLKPAEDAVLYLRVNDSPARLGDNAGELHVGIAPTRGD